MLKFKSQATADLILLESSAQQVLRIIGKEPEPRGIITVEQIPGAIAALREAVARHEAHPDVVEAVGDTEEHGEHPHNDGNVTLRQRVVPFIDMLQRSAAEGKDVVWGV